MPHVSLVAFSGLRVRAAKLTEMGVRLPGLTARAAAVDELPSLGLLTLAAMLPDGWTCSYFEQDGRDDDALLQTIISERPTLVAMSSLTASVKEAYRFADRLRKENVVTVLGGLHATACAEEASRYVDAVCSGEGEFVWPQLLRDAEQNKTRSHYAAVRSTAAASWPIPRFELVAERRPRWTLQTQRGCPLACEFCGSSRLISRFREKPIEQVCAELSAIRRLTPRPVIELADDNTFAGPRDPAPLLDALSECGARFFTEVDWRIGERPELLTRLAASGCVQVLIGIESLVFRFSGMGAKDVELGRVMAAIDRIQAAGIAVNGCFIMGGDGETQDSIDRMIEFILSTSLADVQVTLSTPFPGTPLRARLARQGRLLTDRDWPHYTLFDVTYVPDRMSVSELEAGYRRMLSAVYDAGEARRRATIRRDIWRRNPSLRGGPL